MDDLTKITSDIANLRRDLDATTHKLDTYRPEIDADLAGLLETVSTAPTGIPFDFYDQMKIYSNGTTYRLYWYDATNRAWRYATGT